MSDSTESANIFSVAQNQKLNLLCVTLPMKSAAVVASTAKRANIEMNKSPKFVPRSPEHTNKEPCSHYRNKDACYTTAQKFGVSCSPTLHLFV